MILITAASGKTGRHLVDGLRERGQMVRLLARSASVHEMRADGVETVSADMMNPEDLRSALDGVNAVVHIGPVFHPLETAMGQFVIDGAVAAGVRRFVYFSAYQPQIDFLVNHQAKLRIEDYLINSGLDFTILQPMHYMQNVDPAQVAREGVLRLPYSMSTPLAFVDLVDVAEVATRVLTEDGHVYATYPLCGTDLLSGTGIASQVAERAGVEIRGEEVAIPDFLTILAGEHPLPRYVVDGFYRLFTYYSLHGIRGNPNVLRWLLGREPGTFTQYIERNLASESTKSPAVAG
jgi:uncharacterized protein YbjT (DUF2867 family)